MFLGTLISLIIHLSSLIGSIFFSVLIVIPLLGMAFVLSTTTVALSFLSGVFFEVAIFFYDQCIHFARVELRNLIELLPVGPRVVKGGRKITVEPVKGKEREIRTGAMDTSEAHGTIAEFKERVGAGGNVTAFRPFSGASCRSQFPHQVLGSTVPLQSITGEEEL